jgi:hypothetical protein
MELKQVYIKTAKGQEEIQKRNYKLSASLRKLLIMVDGRSTAAEMMERLSAMGDITLALTELETNGFIASLTPPKPPPPPPPVSTSAVKSLPSAEDPQSERMLLQNVWETDDGWALSSGSSSSTASTPQSRFNLDKAKGFIRSILLSAMGPSAERRIDRVEATTSVEELRVELDALHELLPKVLPKRQAEQVWKQLEPIMQPLVLPPSQAASSAAQPQFNLDKAKGLIRFTLLGAMGPTAGRRIERIDAVTTVDALRVELEAIHELLPKVLSKRQAEQVWKQLEPIIFSIALPPL